MAIPNYGYEKRQKELAKKRKKEEKLLEKAHRKANPGIETLEMSSEGLAPGDPETNVAALNQTPPTIPRLRTKNG